MPGTTELPRTRGLLLSVDVDSLDLYLSLYGHAVDDASARALVETTYTVGVSRFLELFDELGVSATFFAVGRDLAVPAAGRVLSAAAAAGHTVGNHTFSHRYDFIRLPEEAARDEILRGHTAVERTVGTPPVIFRAPGYNMTSREYALLDAMGYRYDASPLPSPPYLAIKYTVMAGVRILGRRSRSIWGNPAAFAGATRPYRRGSLLVLPNAVSPVLRLPVIGTTLSTAPGPLYDHFLSALAREEFVSLEFHAVDLMERQEDGLPEPLRAQRDLSIPVSVKRARFRRFIESLKERLPLFTP